MSPIFFRIVDQARFDVGCPAVRVGWREQGEGHTPEDDGVSKGCNDVAGIFCTRERGLFVPKQRNERPSS
jgi:hypothetical protein